MTDTLNNNKVRVLAEIVSYVKMGACLLMGNCSGNSDELEKLFKDPAVEFDQGNFRDPEKWRLFLIGHYFTALKILKSKSLQDSGESPDNSHEHN